MPLCFLPLGSLKPLKQRGLSPPLCAARAFLRSQTAFLSSKDESRIKATVMDVKPVDYREYGRRLIMNIRRNALM